MRWHGGRDGLFWNGSGPDMKPSTTPGWRRCGAIRDAWPGRTARRWPRLRASEADRAALRFCLIPPQKETEAWRVSVPGVPTTRMGLVSLGQAVSVCPSLSGLRRDGDGLAVSLVRGEAEVFVRTGAPALSAAGYAVSVPPDLFGEHVTVQADLDGGAEPGRRRTVAAALTIRVAGEKVTENELAFLLDQGSSLVFFRNRWIEVDRAVLREALRALQSTKKKNVSVREAVSFAVGVGRLGHLRVDEVRAHGWLRGLLNELKGEDRFELLPPPPGLKADLRDYQIRGYSWLAFLAKWGFGPCLADDMGLGKTVQTIAFLLHQRQKAGNARSAPALVVAPVSVTTNWMRELARFAPGLKTMLHQGTERLHGFAFSKACSRTDVVVTGYALLVKDFKDFAGTRFSTLVLDEAQTVKNADTQAARAAQALEIPVKVALTGTPLENSADDLWAIEACLNPGLLGERRDFSERFTRSIRTDARGGAAARLRHILAPFMLRRLKSDPRIAAELGAKREIRAYCPLSPEQRRQYEEALASYRMDVSAAAGEPSRGRMLALLTELKLICDGDGKRARLDALLADIFNAGESCLIFTQYAKIGRLLQSHLRETFGRTFPFLHGGLSPAAREKEIASFNGDPQPNAFILSLKAGGFGLNLTRATHVIHFDRWWNPAVENQATDRAHRIGQKKTVFVHTFICAGTLEDHIDELLEAKRNVASEVVSGGESFLLSMNARAFEAAVSLDAPAQGEVK